MNQVVVDSISSPADGPSKASIMDHFSPLSDPRMEKKTKHKLEDIIMITICAAICGADDWVAVSDFGKAKQDWLKKFLELPYGIPSHDTFGQQFPEAQ